MYNYSYFECIGMLIYHIGDKYGTTFTFRFSFEIFLISYRKSGYFCVNLFLRILVKRV